MSKFLAIAAIIVLVCAAGASAGPATAFTLVQNQSNLTISGSFGGSSFSQQTPGSLTTSYTGTIDAAITASSIQFTGSSIDAALQPLNQAPAAGGGPGFAPADYGMQANLGVLGTGFAAIRGLLLDMTSGVLPITGLSFPTGETFSITSGAIDYLAGVATGSIPLSGNATNAGLPGALVTNGGIQTLTIPVDMEFGFSVVTTNDTTVRVSGTLIATRAIPEPGTGAIMIAAGLLVFGRGRGR